MISVIIFQGLQTPYSYVCTTSVTLSKPINFYITPILLSNLFLRSLKKTKGHIVNIASIEATRHSKFSALYTATKSGLRDFSLSLFEEVRKDGVKVTSINPDMTMTPFFDELKFKPSNKENSHLMPSEVAKVVLEVISSNSVVTDIAVRSQYFGMTRK